MPIKMTGRYEPGSDKEHAHTCSRRPTSRSTTSTASTTRTPSGLQEITFTFNGQARTAWAEKDEIVHVLDGWDVLPPKTASGPWRGGY